MNSTDDQCNSKPSFTPEQVAHFIKRYGILMLDNAMLDKYPELANCRVAEGFPCLCSAALWSLYLLVYGKEHNKELLIHIHVWILIACPDVSEVAKRALKFYDDYSHETYDGLMRISHGDVFLVTVCIIAQWLFIELTMSDKANYSEDAIIEIDGQIKFWFHRLPPPNMICFAKNEDVQS